MLITPIDDRVPPFQPVIWPSCDVTLVRKAQQLTLDAFCLQNLEGGDAFYDWNAIVELVRDEESWRAPLSSVIHWIELLVALGVLVHRATEMVFEPHQVACLR
jgi:hypothetical protein